MRDPIPFRVIDTHAQGSTPLHFASANGHANLIKILLASGANPMKPDKNGYTPEALAQAAGHIDCVRVFRAWEHLSTGRGTGLEAGPTMSAQGSRRSSQADTVTGAVGDDGAVVGNPPNSAPPLVHAPDVHPTLGDGTEPHPKEKEKSHGFHGLRFRRSFAKGKGKAKADHDELIETTPPHSPLAAIPQRSSTQRLSGTNSSHSSLAARRPSLPSIFERAAHPGASLRAALHRDKRESDSGSSKGAPPQAASSFFRGRHASNETTYSRSRTSSFTESEYQAEGSSNPLAASRRYMSKHSLAGLFRRDGESPHSRSPSPTRPNSVRAGVDPEELEQGLDRLQRASFDLGLDPDYSNTGSPSRFYDTTSMRSTGSDDFYSVPNSPVPEYSSHGPFPVPQRRGRSYSGVSDDGKSRDYGVLNGIHRPRSAGLGERPRTGSEVVSPSPLALEWDSGPQTRPQRPRLSPVSTYSASPRARGHTKKRSATMPSGFPTGTGWDEEVDLRKLASGVFRRESERLIRRDGTPPEALDLGLALAIAPEGTAVDPAELAAALERNEGAAPPKPLIMEIEPTPRETSPAHPPQISPTTSSGRMRGISVSSTSSVTSMMAQSFGQTSFSTSMTPPSSMSAPFNGSSGNSLVGGFPPVPEHCTPGGSIEGSSFPFLDASMRKVSSHAEAQDLKLQSEREVMQAALLPPSLDSSLSLSQQLAAYGDSYILERELAEVERRKDRSRSNVNTPTSASSTGRSLSASSASRQQRPKAPTIGFQEHRTQSQRRELVLSRPQSADLVATAVPEPLVTQTAPDITQLSINRIYDARAAAYRDRAKALTTAPPALQEYARRQRAHRGSLPSEMWLTAGPARSVSAGESTSDELDKHPTISSPMPVALSAVSHKVPRKSSGSKTVSKKTSLTKLATKGSPAIPSFPPSSRSLARQVRSSSASSATISTKVASPSSYMASPNSWAPRSPFGGAIQSHDNSDSSDGGFQRRRERVKVGPPLSIQPETAPNKTKWGIKGMMEQLGRSRP